MRCRLLLVFFILVPQLSQANEVFPSTLLKKYATDNPSAIFSDALIACHLRSLLGEANLKGLEENMQSQEKYQVADELGAYPFPGGIQGLYMSSGGLVLIHPDGRLWVGYLHIDEKDAVVIDFFTNDKNSYKTPPASVLKWAKDFEAEWHYRSSESDKFSEKISSPCSEKALQPKQQMAAAQAGGKLCTSDMAFSYEQVVKGDESEKSAYDGGKQYLVKNDLVLLADSQDAKSNTVCALYVSLSRREIAGFLRKDTLVELNEKFLKERSATPLIAAKTWQGDWENPHGLLTIKRVDDTHIKVSASATHGGHAGLLDERIFKIAGSEATAIETSRMNCRGIKLYAFNNSIYISGTPNEDCGGVNVTFDGVYFKGRTKEYSESRLKLSGKVDHRLNRDEKTMLKKASAKDRPAIKQIIKDSRETYDEVLKK